MNSGNISMWLKHRLPMGEANKGIGALITLGSNKIASIYVGKAKNKFRHVMILLISINNFKYLKNENKIQSYNRLGSW